MFKRIAWLCAASIFCAWAASGTAQPPLKKTGKDPHVPYSSYRDDMPLTNEHAHPLQEIYFPPESHMYQDLDTPPSDQLNRNVRILRTTNKAQLNRYVPVVYSLRNVNPFAVLRFIRRTVQAEEGAVFTFVSPEGNSGRVLVAIPEYQVPYMSDLIKTIDKPGLTSGDGTKRIYRQLKHRRANISADPLLDDSAFANALGIYLTDNGADVVVDPQQNALFIEDSPSGSDYLDNALTESLDKPTPEAVMTTKVYEVDQSNNARIGLDYVAWKNGPGASLFAYGTYNEVGSTVLREGATYNLDNSNGIGDVPGRGHYIPRHALKNDLRSNGQNFAYRYETNSAFFDYLVFKGKARVLNQAKLAALNTRAATITAGDQILYYQVQAADPSPNRPKGDQFAANRGRTVIGTAQELTADGLKPVETGLSMTLTPLIYENGLDITIDGSFTDYDGFDDTGYPRINSRAISTSIRLNVGEETILGGLMRESQVKAANKMPILGSIPLLGYLVGGENTRRTKSEVVVSISADQIVRYDGKGYGVNEGDKAVIDQAEGSKAIQTPASTFGFDQMGLDKEY